MSEIINADKIDPIKTIIKKISDRKVKTKIELSEKLKKLNKLK